MSRGLFVLRDCYPKTSLKTRIRAAGAFVHKIIQTRAIVAFSLIMVGPISSNATPCLVSECDIIIWTLSDIETPTVHLHSLPDDMGRWGVDITVS